MCMYSLLAILFIVAFSHVDAGKRGDLNGLLKQIHVVCCREPTAQCRSGRLVICNSDCADVFIGAWAWRCMILVLVIAIFESAHVTLTPLIGVHNKLIPPYQLHRVFF